METNVIALKDIEELYKDGIEASYAIQSKEYDKHKIGTGLLDDEVPIEILNTIGPYSVVTARGAGLAFIVPSDKIVKKQLQSAMERYTPVLNAVMPNRWYVDRGTLFLYYPVLKITNSIGLDHTIYDLVVKVYVDDSGNIEPEIQGKRYSFTKSELKARYVHSHLPKLGEEEDDEEEYAYFNSFCTGGSSTPFGAMLESLSVTSSSKRFEAFLIQLEEYLKWESVEGKPHINMSDIGEGRMHNGSTLGFESVLYDKMAKHVVELISNHPDPKSVAVTQSGGRYLIDPSINGEWFFENVERKLVEKFNPPYLTHWSPVRNCYIREEERQGVLPQLDDFDTTLVEKFGIQPRIIEEEETTSSTLIKRIGSSNLIVIIEIANNYLHNGCINKVERKDEQRNSITIQGEGSDKQESSSTNTVSTQPVSEESRVVGITDLSSSQRIPF